MVWPYIAVVASTFLINLIVNWVYVNKASDIFPARDVFKSNDAIVTDLGGIAIFIGLAISTIILYIQGMIDLKILLGMISVSALASLIGLIDDFNKTLPGWYKPLSSLLVGLPVIYLHLYDDNLRFFNGYTFNLPIIYPILVLLGFSVASNAVNMLDVINGSAVIGVLTIYIGNALYLAYRGMNPILHLIIISSLSAFLVFNIYPARVFLGNIGSMLIGSLLALQAIIFETEFLTVLAMYPFIVNGLFYLERFRRFVERRVHGFKIVSLDQDGNIRDECEEGAPIVLLKYMVAPGPKTERSLIVEITILFVISTFLSVLILVILG